MRRTRTLILVAARQSVALAAAMAGSRRTTVKPYIVSLGGYVIRPLFNVDDVVSETSDPTGA